MGRIISYLTPFFVHDRVFSKKAKIDGVIVELKPLDEALVRWKNGEIERVTVDKYGAIKDVGKIIEWDE
jgi:hypothetical protein